MSEQVTQLNTLETVLQEAKAKGATHYRDGRPWLGVVTYTPCPMGWAETVYHQFPEGLCETAMGWPTVWKNLPPWAMGIR